MADFRVFIAHSEKDAKFTKKLCRKLKRVGVDNFYLAEAPVEFKPNAALAKTITEEIDHRCQCLIGIITVRSIGSPWVNQEIAYAFRAKKEIILIVEEGVPAPALVSANQYAHFYGSEISPDISRRVVPYLWKLKEKERNNG